MAKKITHHLIFEGAELCGKSWVMSQIYNSLEKKYNHSKVVLDGCHWIGADNGIFGTPPSTRAIDAYVKLFKALKDKNFIVEKFHISDIVYQRLYHKKNINYRQTETALRGLGVKIILLTFPPNKKLLEKRMQDRLRLYPHYKRILKTPQWYIQQQREYIQEVKKSKLPSLQLEIEKFPNKKAVNAILQWIGESK